MDLLQLRYFYDSANYLSISKTAEKYGVPSTSVSASIRRLEKELGCKLFERSPNRISLNEKGILMRDSLHRIFQEMDAMLEAVSGTADDSKEITILVKAIRTMITEQVIEFKKKYTLLIPYSNQSALSSLYDNYTVENVEYIDEGISVVVILDERGKGIYEKYIFEQG